MEDSPKVVPSSDGSSKDLLLLPKAATDSHDCRHLAAVDAADEDDMAQDATPHEPPSKAARTDTDNVGSKENETVCFQSTGGA